MGTISTPPAEPGRPGHVPTPTRPAQLASLEGEIRQWKSMIPGSQRTRRIPRTRKTAGAMSSSRPLDGDWQLRCGIESFFVPQDRALELERAAVRGEAVARVRVDGRGNAALVDVEVSPAG